MVCARTYFVPGRTESFSHVRASTGAGGKSRRASVKQAVRNGRVRLSESGDRSPPLSYRASASAMHLTGQGRSESAAIRIVSFQVAYHK